MEKQQTKVLTEYVDDINECLYAHVQKLTDKSGHIHQNYHQLWLELSQVIHTGGKRLRPQIVLQTYKGMGGTSIESILPIAASLELLHISMLIHDDIIDRDETRHGIDNMTGVYKKLYLPLVADEHDRQHFAESAALLAGDAVLSEAYALLGEPEIDPQIRRELFSLFQDAVFQVIGGELLDTEASLLPVGAISSTIVMEQKTASYSFITPLLIGARLAGGDEASIQDLRQFGYNLGLAFQLQDDYIGVFGDQEKSGKSTIGDLREGKRTRLIELFYELASEEQQRKFQHYHGNSDLTEQDAAHLRQLLIESGATATLTELIRHHETKARDYLANVDLTEESRQFFDQLIHLCVTRSH